MWMILHSTGMVLLLIAAFECPEHSHYELCASACPATCSDPDAESTTCDQFCQEGCVCDEGFMKEGDLCVAAEACGKSFNNS